MSDATLKQLVEASLAAKLAVGNANMRAASVTVGEGKEAAKAAADALTQAFQDQTRTRRELQDALQEAAGIPLYMLKELI